MGSVRARWSRWFGVGCAAVACASGAGAQSGVQLDQSGTVSQKLPQLLEATPVTGSLDMFNASAAVANLDAGDLVAGRTWWILDEILYTETYVGFLWNPRAGATVFEIPQAQYFDDNVQIVQEIADDGTVVGVNWFTGSLTTRPFRFTSAGGFEFLELPGPGWNGSAVAVSADATLIGGGVHQGFAGASRAAAWVDGALRILGPAGSHSMVNDVDDTATTAVGEIGTNLEDTIATRWVNGIELGLPAVPGASASKALFCSDDGAVTIGVATIGGLDALVRWVDGGAVEVAVPPAGLAVRDVNAIDPTGSVAVGALVADGDGRPFVWRTGGRFEVIGELGLEAEYDLSEATAVSDDGRRVVGNLQSSVVFQGDPPSTAFLWTRADGTRALDDLVLAGGGPDLGLFSTQAISGDGTRVLATGVVKPTQSDTTSVVLELP